MASAPTSMVEAITQMFNALVTAMTNVVTAIANWVSANADLIASLVMIGLLIVFFIRVGRRMFEAIRGVLPL